MSKEREIDGIRIVVNGEQYEAYKGTLQDQINELQDRIDKAIEYFNELEKENNKIIKFEVQHDEYQHIIAEAENTLIDDVKKILK